MRFDDDDVGDGLKSARNNQKSVWESDSCACFKCMELFPSRDVEKYMTLLTSSPTALCPLCGAEAVIPSATGLPVWDKEFLQAVHDRYFGKKDPCSPP
jgi:hypothetical protein